MRQAILLFLRAALGRSASVAINAKATAEENKAQAASPELAAAITRATAAEEKLAAALTANEHLADRVRLVEAELTNVSSLLEESEARLAQIAFAQPVPVPAGETIEQWAVRQAAKFRVNVALQRSHLDLDPDVREKVAAGLTIEQAITAVSAQRRHDAGIDSLAARLFAEATLAQAGHDAAPAR